MAHQLANDLKAQLTQKRLIFTVTTGRSGTNYLTNMLSYLPNVTSLHEPEPDYHHVLRSVQHQPELAYEFLIERKLPAIAADKAPIYIETSHLFCKGFFEPLLDLGIVPDLILLSRDKRSVAKSMYQLNQIPARTEIGRNYLVQPDDPQVLPLPNWESLHDYQLCYWYTLEIERRQQVYSAEVKKRGGMVYAITLEDFSTIKGFWSLLWAMKLPFPYPLNAARHFRSHLFRSNTLSEFKNTEKSADYAALEFDLFKQMQRT